MDEPVIGEESWGYVYRIINKLDGTQYIGVHGHTPGESWRAYMGSGRAIRAAIESLGEENFSKELVAEAADSWEAQIRELQEIKKLRDSGLPHYNFTSTEYAAFKSLERVSPHPLFGWEDDGITSNDSEAAVVREAVDLIVARGITTGTIADYWNESNVMRRGQLTRNGEWLGRHVFRTLNDPRLCGVPRSQKGLLLRYKSSEVVGKWEPIITVARWLQLQEAIVMNTERRRSGLLALVIACSCGGRMFAQGASYGCENGDCTVRMAKADEVALKTLRHKSIHIDSSLPVKSQLEVIRAIERVEIHKPTRRGNVFDRSRVEVKLRPSVS